jgi:hypothetical protein
LQPPSPQSPGLSFGFLGAALPEVFLTVEVPAAFAEPIAVGAAVAAAVAVTAAVAVAVADAGVGSALAVDAAASPVSFVAGMSTVAASSFFSGPPER